MTKDFSNLINIYKETIKDEKKFLDTRSAHWKNYYHQREKFSQLDNLINFRKNQILSQGLDDAMNLQNKLNLLDALENFDADFLKKNLPKKNIGNCENSANFLGFFFDYGIIHHLKWFQKIEERIQDKFNVLEIGGGFGSLARIILNNKDVKYFSIDLPEANLMTNYYLANHFPEKKIFNYIDFKDKKIEDEINNYDIFILPPNTLEEKNIFFDFIINSRSFMEMNKKTIDNYFNFIHKKIKKGGQFLNINRYNKTSVGEEIRFENYPYDNNWEVEISEKSFLQDSMHFLLTTRKENGQILEELKKIKQKNINNKGVLGSFVIFKLKLKRYLYLILKKILIVLIGKKGLKKISRIIYDISEK